MLTMVVGLPLDDDRDRAVPPDTVVAVDTVVAAKPLLLLLLLLLLLPPDFSSGCSYRLGSCPT